MATTHVSIPAPSGWMHFSRLLIGVIWLAGAAFNALVTLRMTHAYEWLEQSPIPIYRWFFRDIVAVRPVFWTVLLITGELLIGALTLARGGWAKLGLAGGALFSALLFSFASSYTIIMGPYAILLAWLSRKEYPTSAFGWLLGRGNHRSLDG